MRTNNRSRATMRHLIILSIALSLGFGGTLMASSAKERPCPDASLKETSADCPYNPIARQMGLLKTLPEAISALRQALPKVTSELNALKQNPEWIALWGQSINFDEYAKQQIVSPLILDTIASLSGKSVRQEGNIVHAGLEHTFGYLFSTLYTPFGYKRWRWTKPTITQGFALRPGLWQPGAVSGNFFANVTYFLLRLTHPQLIPTKKSAQMLVAEELKSYDFKKLKLNRIIETLGYDDAHGQKKTARLLTDIVPFIQSIDDPNDKNSHLLIYSIVDEQSGEAKLITAFPIENGFANALLDAKNEGTNVSLRTKYNGFLQGVTGKVFQGTREIIRSSEKSSR